MAREKKKQERIDLAPVQALQPKARSIRYDNMKSAMAEEQILVQALKEPALLALRDGLVGSDFPLKCLAVFSSSLSAVTARAWK